MLVYRIENRKGLGPYQTFDKTSRAQIMLADKICDAHMDYWHPTPRSDGMSSFSGKVFGFRSMRELSKWFEDFGKALTLARYWISVYEVPDSDICFGGMQLAFSQDKAVKVNSYRPNEFVK